jgi:Flp pilus assembly protein TadD
VALAGCLLEHAATVTDPQAAGKERLRARDLLQSARDLGNHSTLAMNLSELMAGLSADGSIRFSDNSATAAAIAAGEAAFARRDFAAAIEQYRRALALDPKSYTATLFIANSYDKAGDLRQGAQWYERATHLDTDIETAYRYYADMVARQGEMSRARTLLIHAAVAEPYNRVVWRELKTWATLNGTRLNEILVVIPAPLQNSSPEPPQIAAAWQAYREISARWQGGDEEFRKHFPDEKQYRHSLPQEAAALAAAAARLASLTHDPAGAALVKSDASARLLLRLHASGLIEPYVLFSLGDQGIAQDYKTYRALHRDMLEAYLEQLVVPPAPGQSTSRPHG